MIICPSCNATDFVEAYTSISHSWQRCTTCYKLVSLRLQEGRGERRLHGKREEELVECKGEINVNVSTADAS